MAVTQPDDPIEFLGKYLMHWVERKTIQSKNEKYLEEVENKAKELHFEESAKGAAAAEKFAFAAERKQKLKTFVEDLPKSFKSKDEIMAACVTFLSEFLEVPSVYIARKIPAAEGFQETLKYICANAGQEHIIGRKLVKPPEDADEVVAASGLSFDVFKLPSVPETEEELDENGEPLPLPPPPKLAPIVIDNVMRDSRVKFFGVPKLGSFAAVPLELMSLDHELGAKFEYNEENAETISQNKISSQLMIAMDTIGKYRRFTEEDLSIVSLVGDSMVAAMAAAEEDAYAKHLKCLDVFKPLAPAVAAAMAEMKDEEDQCAAASTGELAEEEKSDIGPLKEAEARALFWTQRIINTPISTASKALLEYVLPMPTVVTQLLFAIGCVLGVDGQQMRDKGGDISWNLVRQFALEPISSTALTYSPSNTMTVSKEASIDNVKVFCETNNLLDPTAYPKHLQMVVPLMNWLQKNIAARELAVQYFRDVKQTEIEIIA